MTNPTGQTDRPKWERELRALLDQPRPADALVASYIPDALGEIERLRALGRSGGAPESTRLSEIRAWLAQDWDEYETIKTQDFRERMAWLIAECERLRAGGDPPTDAPQGKNAAYWHSEALRYAERVEELWAECEALRAALREGEDLQREIDEALMLACGPRTLKDLVAQFLDVQARLAALTEPDEHGHGIWTCDKCKCFNGPHQERCMDCGLSRNPATEVV